MGLGTNAWCCSASALCKTRDNNGNLYQREVRLGESVSLERSGKQRRNEAEEADEEDGILEYDSSSSEDLDDESFSTNNEEGHDDVGGIPSLDREATFCLERFHISEEM